MDNPFSLKDQTAVVTGGGTGIGKAIAKCFIGAGARVVVVGRRREILEETCKELGDRAEYFVHDITRLEQTPAFVETIHSRIGTPHILVNNAGIHLKKSAAQTTDDDVQNILNATLLGAHALTRAFLPMFTERRSGSIVFITSMAAVFGIPGVCAYAAAKSSLSGLVRCYAAELSPLGIRVNAIAPGWIDTDMTQKALADDPERQQRILSRTPMRRLGTPDDIGWAAVYLCSPAASFVTGQQLIVDGGVSIGF